MGVHVEEKKVEQERGKGLRFNRDKLRVDLISPLVTDEFAKVLTYGAKKYGERNYQKGMPWMTVVASLERHIKEFKHGIDVDDESKCLHLAHVIANAGILIEYYKLYPEGDDRQHPYLQDKKIALDIDGVIADFSAAFHKEAMKEGIDWYPEEQVHWTFPESCQNLWNRLKNDKNFWLSIPPLCDPHLPFEPVAYVTARNIPVEWTREWLLINKFPNEKVYSVGDNKKTEAIKDSGAEVFVDDCFKNFLYLNKEKVLTYLFDRPYNRKYKVGFKRISSLEELL
jgi:uncharacterized HAD superfamily protein